MKNLKVPYCKHINTDAFIDEWNDEWSKGEYDVEDWKLVGYPIMPDGTVLLIFRMDADIYGGTVDNLKTDGRLSYYRVIHMVIDDKIKITGKYRFKGQAMNVKTAFFKDGILYAVINVFGKNTYTVTQVWPGSDDENNYLIGDNLNCFAVNSDGEFICGYEKNMLSEKKEPVVLVHKQMPGIVKTSVTGNTTIKCSAAGVTPDGRSAYHVFPGNNIYVFNPGSDRENYIDGSFEKFRTDLSGFTKFGFSDDMKYLVTAFEESDNEYVIGVMKKDGDSYTDYSLIEFNPYEDDCEYCDLNIIGKPEISGSKMIINAEGVLFCFDLNDISDGES